MVSFIDIHCHLDFPQIYPKIDSITENAKKAGVNIILTSGINKKTNRLSLKLAEEHSIIKPALGFYPPDALHREESSKEEFNFNEKEFKEELQFIRKNKDRIYAIGEIGLDYKDGRNKELQKKVFISFLRLAKQLDKPAIIHSRKAEQDAIDILEQEDMKKVIMHCFSGKKHLIKRASDLGCYFSIPTNVVRAENIQGIIKIVPLNRLFAETDSPFLSPFKEKQNEPSFVTESYKKIAEIKGLTLEEVKNNLFMNWQRLFD
ncbi:MAG: TatD family hydrolase [Nanoarchaeota archaeon]|nr:TatD family hydrolase [Nanoarchaeota archaeon]